jgi:hypothetical protein
MKEKIKKAIRKTFEIENTIEMILLSLSVSIWVVYILYKFGVL